MPHSSTASHAEVSRLARDRIDQGRIEPKEGICWIFAAFLADPAHWRDDFRSLPDDEACSTSVGIFLASARVPREDLARCLEPSDVIALVQLAGALNTRHGIPEKAYWAVSHVVSSLATETSAAATQALQVLANAPAAQPWLGHIADTRLASHKATQGTGVSLLHGSAGSGDAQQQEPGQRRGSGGTRPRRS